MTGTNKVVRLSKAAREFNISIDTIVSFLTDKGYDIDRKPNTKLDPSMYEMLTTEFQDEKNVKEVALKKGLEYVGRESMKTDEPAKPKEKAKIVIPEEQELIIKDSGMSYDYNKSAEEKVPEQEVIPEAITQDEIIEDEIGIEIDTKEQSSTEQPTAEQPTTEPITTKIDVTETTEQENSSNTKEKIIEPIAEELSEPVETTAKEEEIPEKTVLIKEKEKEIIEEIQKTEPEVIIVDKAPEKNVTEDVESEIIPDTTPELEEKEPTEKQDSADTDTTTDEAISDGKAGINILGSIDLASLNQRTRPTKKSKAEKKKERELKLATTNKAKQTKSEKTNKVEKKPKKTNTEHVAKQPKKAVTPPPAKPKAPEIPSTPAKTAPTEEKQDNFLKTNIPVITGPTITGEKIDLKQFEKKPWTKKKIASSSDSKAAHKKKRKRIKPKPQTTESVNKSGNTGGAKSKGGFKKKPFTKGKPRVVKTEPTEEEIQQKIKDTLARLAPSGKSKAAKHRKRKRETVSETIQQELQKQEDEKKIIKVTEFVTANEMATMMNVGVTEIITSCMQLGLFVSINQRLDAETIVLVAEEFGYQTSFVSVDDNESLEVDEVEDDPASLVDRAPIVTVMGHVDHGKTKLLDYIRHANVVSGEAGGITQHIGAYEVKTETGKKITFLDTPGHEAFTAMRARGAKVTDVAIIVIAADDSVMPQTKEAINHAQAAGVPIVFAINKMDKEGANAEKVKEQLANMNILVEDWGGKFQSQEISAITGMGINELLEKVLLEAEMLELKANPDKVSKGTVIEATLDKGRGYVTTILVQDGTLKKGDILLAGPVFGKVKAMFNERNQSVIEAGPSTPVIVLGLVAAPQAGDIFNGMKDEKEAKILASKRQQLIREQGLRTQKHLTLDEIGRRIAIGEFKELNVIVKGDVDGSIEALTDALLKLSTDEVQVNVIHKAVGAISESDVMLASASDAIIIGFQVRPSVQARRLAEKEEIDIRLYSIIYQATEELETAIKGMLSPKIEEKITCNIEVRETFKITKVGTIAGCYVLDGKVKRNTKVRVIRDGIVIYTGLLGSLKRFKDDVKEVATGYECGLNIENFNDIKVSDIIEGYELIEVSR